MPMATASVLANTRKRARQNYAPKYWQQPVQKSKTHLHNNAQELLEIIISKFLDLSVVNEIRFASFHFDSREYLDVYVGLYGPLLYLPFRTS